MRRLKTYVRNMTYPEGSIAEGYLADECLTFCSRYLHNMETRFNRLPRNFEGVINNDDRELAIFSQTGRPLNTGKRLRKLTLEEWNLARLFVLRNCNEVNPFLK